MRRLLILACCLVCVLALNGCPPASLDGDIEVHIDSNCNIVFADGTSANPLNLEIHDKVRWINDYPGRVYINFGSTELFGRKVIRLNHEGSTTRTTVKSSAAGYEEYYVVDCGEEGGSGNPKVKVGDDDGGG